MKPLNLVLLLLSIIFTATITTAQNQSQLEFQNPPGSETFGDTTLSSGVHAPGTPGIEISNQTQYAKQENAPPIFTAEAGDDNFRGNWPLVGLLGLLGLWGYFRKPVERDDVV